MSTKKLLRQAIGARRETLRPEKVTAMSAQVVANLKQIKPFHASKTVALYKAISGEVNVDALFQKCWELGKQTCIPIFNPASKLYEMAEVTAKTKYTTGHYGIKEPLAPVFISMSEVDLMVVPGVAFDHRGSRLGRGGGYYDRLMADFSGFSAAVAFDFQMLSHIPCEAHDKPVQAIVTNTKIINVL